MCTSINARVAVAGSAKGSAGWTRVDTAVVGFDHPHHAGFDHALTLDFMAAAGSPGDRVAVELSAESARDLVREIEAALAAAAAQGIR